MLLPRGQGHLSKKIMALWCDNWPSVFCVAGFAEEKGMMERKGAVGRYLRRQPARRHCLQALPLGQSSRVSCLLDIFDVCRVQIKPDYTHTTPQSLSVIHKFSCCRRKNGQTMTCFAESRSHNCLAVKARSQ